MTLITSNVCDRYLHGFVVDGNPTATVGFLWVWAGIIWESRGLDFNDAGILWRRDLSVRESPR